MPFYPPAPTVTLGLMAKLSDEPPHEAPTTRRARAFVAVSPPLEVREALLGTARGLPITGEVRWVKPENVHLTLKFLGDVVEEDLARVTSILESVCGRHESFEVAPSGFGAFPSARRARILWAGVGEGAERLTALAHDVQRSLESLSFEPEKRPYRPHLTLGRARGRPAVLGAAGITPPGLGFPVNSVELVESVLGEAGATYSTLASRALRKR
jgi:RNA 2',3'-cyclic 3'-phosphodiesterase